MSVMEKSLLVAFENVMALRKPTDVLMRKRPAGALRELPKPGQLFGFSACQPKTS